MSHVHPFVIRKLYTHEAVARVPSTPTRGLRPTKVYIPVPFREGRGVVATTSLWLRITIASDPVTNLMILPLMFSRFNHVNMREGDHCTTTCAEYDVPWDEYVSSCGLLFDQLGVFRIRVESSRLPGQFSCAGPPDYAVDFECKEHAGADMVADSLQTIQFIVPSLIVRASDLVNDVIMPGFYDAPDGSQIVQKLTCHVPPSEFALFRDRAMHEFPQLSTAPRISVGARWKEWRARWLSAVSKTLECSGVHRCARVPVIVLNSLLGHKIDVSGDAGNGRDEYVTMETPNERRITLGNVALPMNNNAYIVIWTQNVMVVQGGVYGPLWKW